MNYYVPILTLVAIAAAFVAVMILVSIVLGPHRHNNAKFDVYECGVELSLIHI